MAVAVIMPELGESIVEGTIVRWLKQEGDSVQEDEPIVEIMTNKVNTELPAPASGVLQQILAPANATVKVGQELALIATASESAAKRPMSHALRPRPCLHAAASGGGRLLRRRQTSLRPWQCLRLRLRHTPAATGRRAPQRGSPLFRPS
jgi:pyruvate/2-oxoglutarate dehydrogenase complex dihydrolipoamide acyltransferase (E2) component